MVSVFLMTLFIWLKCFSRLKFFSSWTKIKKSGIQNSWARNSFIQSTNYFLSSIKTQGGDVSDRQTSILGSEPYIKILNSTRSLTEIIWNSNCIWNSNAFLIYAFPQVIILICTLTNKEVLVQFCIELFLDWQGHTRFILFRVVLLLFFSDHLTR